MLNTLCRWTRAATILVVVLGVSFLSSSPCPAMDQKASFDELLAWGYIEKLAQDAMLGRKSGHDGGVMAEDYIASKLEEWGVEPAGENGTYFQTFTVPYWNLEEGAVLEIRAGENRDFYYGEDWRVQKFSGSGQFTTEIVFVGYGIKAPEEGYDDYEGMDVNGKLVLFRTGAPRKLVKKLEEKAKMEKRISAAYELGARGVMVFRDPSSGSQRIRIRLKKEDYRPDFVVLTVENEVTDYIVKDLENDFRVPFRKIDETSKPMSFATGVKAFVSVRVDFDAERKTRNVLGKITGSDRSLQYEYVVVGGHMDHLGVSPLGDVYNGANDNASGTAVTMEIARVVKANDLRPKRTVIFGLWAAEEQGLLGSKHYCDDPTLPIEKTVTYFNMDMVAHGESDGKIGFRGEYYGPRIWDTLKGEFSEEISEYVEPGRGGPGGSDHSPFLEMGVPAFSVNSPGPHYKYHQGRDDNGLVNPEMLKKVGDAVYSAVLIMADAPGDFIEPRRRETYHLKVQNLVNYRLSGLEEVIEHHGDAKDSHVDIQFAVVPEKEELAGDALRVEMVNSLLSASTKIEKSQGFVLFTSGNGVSSNVRQGKTTLAPGLVGVRSFEDEPAWARVLAQQGANFLFVEDPAFLFEGDALSDKGKEVVETANGAGLLLMVRGANPARGKALLEHSKKPLVLILEEVPDEDILDIIKEKDSALALLLTSDADPSEYFQKMETIKEAIGTKYLMMMNEECVRHEGGKTAVLDVVSEIVKAEYEGEDFANVFSGTFLRVLDEARDVGPEETQPVRPF